MDRDALVERLLDRHGRTFADEAGIDLTGGGSDASFQLCVLALLMGARIGSDVALAAARALFESGMTSARSMHEADRQQRVDALGRGGYRRYDESTATYLGETAALLLARYDGDLDGLREAAGHDPAREEVLLQECKGVGRVGAAIFLREVQAAWSEARPYADTAVTSAAGAMGLPHSPRGLADVFGDDLSRPAAALVRADRAGEVEALRTGADLLPSPTQLATATKQRLLELARVHDIPGRSRMRRDELAAALAELG